MKNNFDGILKINEIFLSFQGESTFIGMPTLFIRLNGCNLKCKICDTKYSWKNKYRTMSCKNILKLVDKTKVPFVCITGGEPLLQTKELLPLIKDILKLKRIISIETNGSLSIKGLPNTVKRVVDIKTPSTGFKTSFNNENLKYLTNYDEVKFVISNKKDFEFAEQFIQKHKLIKIGCTILMSPNLAKQRLASQLIGWILESGKHYMFQPQLHKLMKEKPIYLIERL